MRVFLADTTSYLGKALKAQLIAGGHQVLDPVSEVDTEIFDPELAEQEEQSQASKSQSKAPGQKSTKKLESLWTDLNGLLEMLMSAELVILDLVNDPDKAGDILNMLKDSPPGETSINLIGVSNVMTWSRTTSKPDKVLSEKDYKSRKTTTRYKGLRMMETLVLNAQREGLNTLVVASGLIYGEGEHDLHALFRDAWMCENKKGLPIVGDGSNIIPTIHITDLAIVLERLGTEFPPPDQQYLVATDKSTKTQREIVSCLANNLGNGQVYEIPSDNEELLLGLGDVAELLEVNLRFGEDTFIAGIDLPLVTPQGFVDGFAKVVAEFIKMRGLKPLRITLQGPPGAGKSFYAAKLSDIYKLPVLTLNSILDDTLEGKDEFAEQVRLAMDEQENQKAIKAKKKAPPPPKKNVKGKAGGKPAPGGGTVDLQPRIPLDLQTKMVMRKLSSASCRNKGFILDGYPRTSEEAAALFKVEGAEAEESPVEEESKEAVLYNAAFMVSHVIALECSMEVAAERIKVMPESAVIADHNDEEGFHRRWATFEAIHDPNAEMLLAPLNYFRGLEILEMPLEFASDERKALASMAIYLERSGKPMNYHPTPEEEALQQAQEAIILAERLERESSEAAAKAREERNAFLVRELKNQNRKQLVLHDDEELIETCSLPLRKYLMMNVIPTLIDGLVDVCQTKPEDPIDYLAEYLFKASVGSSQ